MKKWMALLLACLLCLFVAGAMAEEPVTLSLNNGNQIDIYPDGYQEKNKTFVSYKGPYVITGTSSGVDTCLDFYSIPHNASQDTEPVTYTVTFKDVNITAATWATAIRFGVEEGKDARAKDITLNLINIGKSEVEPYYNHVVFSNQSENGNGVTVNIHNTSGSSLHLFGGNGVAGNKVTVKVNGTTRENDTEWTILESCDQFELIPAEPATCTSNGIKQHWMCERCNILFNDENGLQATTLSALTIASGHSLMHVPAKDPTCTVDGHIEHWKCTGTCGKLFADANGTKELTADEVILPKLVRTDSLPQTGDSSHLLRWMAVLLGACFGVVAVRSRRRG